MSYSERIEQLVEFEGSRSKFCDKTGLTRQTVSRVINQGSGINGDTIFLIAQAYPNLNLEWFITGTGEMWKPDVPAERETPLTDAEKDRMKDEMIELLKFQVNAMKKAILEKAPELAEYLNIEDAKE